MIRIKEDDVKELLKSFNDKNLKIEMCGIIKQENNIENAKILFYSNDIEFEIYDNKNRIIFNLSFIDEIYFKEKNKLKFLINNNLEILIVIE